MAGVRRSHASVNSECTVFKHAKFEKRAVPENAMIRIEPEAIKKKGKVPKNRSLFFTTSVSTPSTPHYFLTTDSVNHRHIMVRYRCQP